MKTAEKMFSKNISKDQAKDSGLALTLILLITWFFTGNMLFCKLAILLVILDMIQPLIFYPFAIVWFGLSKLLGLVASKAILAAVFIILVVPVGVVRKMLGRDVLQLKKFKKDSKSAMRTRDHIFTRGDLEKPY